MRDIYTQYGSVDALPFPDKPRWIGLLAFAEGKAGHADEALARIDEALALAKKTTRPKDLGDLYILKGELVLMKSASSARKAKQCFSTAIEFARDQGAKSDELTATIQLARVLAQEGRREQARARLKKIYNWFTEGFDSADLKEAKALLDELNSSAS